MIRYLLLPLLLHVIRASITTSFNTHYSDVLKIKCEALPYRSVFSEFSCYFVISTKLSSSEASKRCSEVLSGADLTGDAPDNVWEALLSDPEQFFKEEDFSGTKKAMCLYESKYKCASGSGTSIAGKCMHNGVDKMTFKEAESFCDRVGSLPNPQNDIENRDVAAASRYPVWLRPTYAKTWAQRTDFSRYGTCASTSPFYTANDPKWCSVNVAIAANPENLIGYWALVDQTHSLDVICISDAENVFWTAPPRKPSPVPVKDCMESHVWNDKRQRCEWTGPADACVQLVHNNGKSAFINIPRYPAASPAIELLLMHSKAPSYEDRTTRAIVRRGCLATFWMHRYSTDGAEFKILRSVEYGIYQIANYENGAIESPNAAYVWHNGLSKVSCYCDPLETEREKPAKSVCVEHHEWSEEKQRCVWKLDNKYAGEIETSTGQKMKLEIPNWPLYKRYEVNLRDAKLNDYINKITKIIVRQGCFCTIYSGTLLYSWQSRPTTTYGSYGCFAKNGVTPTALCAAQRVVCECMNEDSGTIRRVADPKVQPCAEQHKYDEKTKRCEWTGPKNGCVHLTNTRNEKMFVELGTKCGVNQCNSGIVRFYAHAENTLSKAVIKNWDKQVTWMTVRRGCEASVYVAQQFRGVIWQEYMTLEHAAYGKYRVQQKNFGDVEVGSNRWGASQVNCVCDKSVMENTPAPPSTPCLDGHTYDHKTGQCEWTRDKRICGVIRNELGQTQELVIPNWPAQKKFSWNLIWTKKTIPSTTLFYKRIVGITVRQHCFATMYSGAGSNTDIITLSTSGYGNHTVKAQHNGMVKKLDEGTSRVICGCFE